VPRKKYFWFGPRLNGYTYSNILPNPPVIFTRRVKKCDVWFRFLILVAFEALWFWNWAMYRKPKTNTGSAYDRYIRSSYSVQFGRRFWDPFGERAPEYWLTVSWFLTVVISSVCRHYGSVVYRRKASKSSSNGRVADTTTKKTKRDQTQPAIYELETEVTGDANSLDKNGRLVSTTQDELTRENDNNFLRTYANTDGYCTIAPIQVSQADSNSPSPIYSQVNKKRAAGTAEHEADTTSPDDSCAGDGKGGNGSGGERKRDRTACDSIHDTTLVDNPIYSGVTMPASPPPPPASSTSATPAAAAEAGHTCEPICTSINDFTLIDNVIYNN